MKKIIFLTLTLIGAYATSYAKRKVPSDVISAFDKQFPNASNVKWDKENAHEYEASFVWNGEKLSANFYDNGEWLETESPTTFDQLPERVQEAFNASHPGAKIKAIAKIETSKGSIKYEVEIKQGIKTAELFYDVNGNEVEG